MAKKFQAKDIPDVPVLEFISKSERWCTWFPGFDNSVQNAMPKDAPEKVVLAKMKSLIKRGLIDGCDCGCRGDYEMTSKGKQFLKEKSKMTTVEQPYSTRSFTENAPQGHVRTVFHVDNPLQNKLNETHLKDIAAISQKDRYAWIDAEIRKVLPEKFYRLVVDSWTEKDRKKACDMMAQAEHHMRNNRIQIVHPGGRSLQTYIYVKGKIVAEYELRLDTK